MGDTRISVEQFSERYNTMFNRENGIDNEAEATPELKEKRRAGLSQALAEINVDKDQWITIDEFVSAAGARMTNTFDHRVAVDPALPNRMEKASLRDFARINFDLDAPRFTKLGDDFDLGWEIVKDLPGFLGVLLNPC